MKRIIGIGGLLTVCMLLAPAVLASGWDGWTYLGDDGADPVDNAFMDIRNHGYKIENGIWWFKADLNGPYPSERPEGYESYCQFVKIDTRPGGEPGTGADYMLEHLIGSGFATYEWIGGYWTCIRDMGETPFDSGDNWWAMGIRISDLDVQWETVDFWWETKIATDEGQLDIDNTNVYSISGSEVSISMLGLLALSLLLIIPLVILAKIENR